MVAALREEAGRTVWRGLRRAGAGWMGVFGDEGPNSSSSGWIQSPWVYGGGGGSWAGSGSRPRSRHLNTTVNPESVTH